MYPDCHTSKIHSNCKKIRLRYTPYARGQVHSDINDNHNGCSRGDKCISQTRLEGNCRLFKTGIKHFILDTGAPFTIVSHDVWRSCQHHWTKPELVSWDNGTLSTEPSDKHAITWGSRNLQGEFHWVDFELLGFGRHDVRDSVIDTRILAFCLTQSIEGLPDVLLGLGCQGIESHGLCLNLGKDEYSVTGQHDAWLIDLRKGSAHAP